MTAPRGGLLTAGAALALYFSSNAIEALRVGLDRAYACPETRPWWLLRLQSLAFMVIGAAALLGARRPAHPVRITGDTARHDGRRDQSAAGQHR